MILRTIQEIAENGKCKDISNIVSFVLESAQILLAMHGSIPPSTLNKYLHGN